MRWVLKWSGRVLLVALVVLAAGAGLVGVHIATSLPVVAGDLRLAGLNSSIYLRRDRYGVPHIEAQSQADAYFGLGFAHAQDRLWQMHLARMNVAGRLTEIFGTVALRHDIEMRAMGYHELARRALAVLSPETVALLSAYTRGVNAYLDSSIFRTPPEFVLTATGFERWANVHTLDILFSFWPTLAQNTRKERLHASIAQLAGPETVKALFRPFPENTGRVALELADLVSTMGPTASTFESTRPLLQAPSGEAETHSNNWVLGSTRSATGFPLLANDPHLRLSTPSVWYLAHLSYGDERATGVTVPGGPSIIIGHNHHVAWGFTTSQVDTDDHYIERLHPKDPSRYQTPDGYRSFEERAEVFHVRFSDTVVRRLRRSRHGPILPREVWASGGQGQGYELAVSSTVDRIVDETIVFFFKLNAARTWADAVDAARHCGLPPHNMVFASREGDIGYIMVGVFPERGPRHESQGLWPVEGAKAGNDWLGLVPPEDRPRVKNPRVGYLVTANGRIVPKGFSRPVTAAWRDPGRGQRIEALLGQIERHDLDTMASVQLDQGSTKVFETLKYLLQTKPVSERGERALALLKDWDGGYGPAAPQPAIYHAFMDELLRTIVQDELGPAWALARGRRPELIRDAFRGDLSAWCDDRATAARESCKDLLAESLERALDGLDMHYGDDYQAWRWGEQLTIEHTHLGLGFLPGLGSLFSTRTAGAGGPSTPNVAYPKARALPRIVGRSHGASLRFLADLSNLERSRFVISTGQSGHFRSPHYRDLQGLWAAGEYVEIPSNPHQVSPVQTLHLNPR